MIDKTAHAKIAEQAAALRFAIATSDDGRISNYMSPLYEASTAMLTTAVAEAWGEQLAMVGVTVADVIETWVDCGESIGYCVSYEINRANAEARERRESKANDFLDTDSGADFLRHVATVTGFAPAGDRTVNEDVALVEETVKVLTAQTSCACGGGHTLIRIDAGLL